MNKSVCDEIYLLEKANLAAIETRTEEYDTQPWYIEYQRYCRHEIHVELETQEIFIANQAGEEAIQEEQNETSERYVVEYNISVLFEELDIPNTNHSKTQYGSIYIRLIFFLW